MWTYVGNLITSEHIFKAHYGNSRVVYTRFAKAVAGEADYKDLNCYYVEHFGWSH